MRWHATWHTGPDCDGPVVLQPGTHLVGRAPTATVRCDDPRLEAHHLLLRITAEGLHVVRLAADGHEHTDPEGPWASSVDLSVGDSVLRLSPEPLRGVVGDEPAVVRHDGTVLRAPRAVPDWAPADLPDVPPPAGEAAAGHGTLLPALLGVVGSAAMAVVMRQPMFVVFGAVGAFVALGSWAAQRLAAHRRRRRDDAAHHDALTVWQAAAAADRAAASEHVRQRVPTTAGAVATARDRRGLWSRRTEHGDATVVGLGVGAVPWRDGMPALPDRPIELHLVAGVRLAVTGPAAHGVVRSLVAQLATSCGPADVRMIVVTERPDEWSCWDALPHLRGGDGRACVVPTAEVGEVLAELQAGGDHRAQVVLLTDDAHALGTRTGPLRRALAAHPDLAMVAALPDARAPQLCTAVLATADGPWAEWTADTRRPAVPLAVRITGLGRTSSAAVTRSLAGLRDPEDLHDSGRLPPRVHLTDLLGLAVDGAASDAAAIRRRWERHGTASPVTPIGVASDGVVEVDLGRDGPHGLLAGTTGAGKSELLRTLVAGLAAAAHPRHLQMVLIDYKGGATFDDLRTLPHVAGVVTDLDDELADRALRSLYAELRRRESMLRAAGAADLEGLLRRGGELARLLVVVDEFAALVAEQPTFLHALLGVAQRGRSLGVHLLLATQRPHGVISDDIRANTNLRIALRLQDDADAVDVVGDRRPATLPRRTPGRAVMRLGADELLEFQTAHLHDVRALVAAVVEAAGGFDPPAPPWLPPLPQRLERADVPPGCVGWCDDPDRQRRVPLHWSADDGGVLVAGAPGTGVTSTLRTLSAQALSHGAAVHVLTANADAAWNELAAHDGAVVVCVDDRPLVARLLHRLDSDAWRPPAGSRSVVVVDGVEAVRRALDDIDGARELDRLDDVLASARHVPLLGTTHPAAVPSVVVSRCTTRWVLHLPDRHDAASLGVTAPASKVPGRLVVAGDGLHAQVMLPVLPPLPAGARVPPIEPVPAVVPSATLPRTSCVVDGRHHLALGVDTGSGGPAAVAVPEGEHLLVLGGARTGRSTVLTRVAASFRDAHPDAVVVAVLPRRSMFRRSLADVVHHDLSSVPADQWHGRSGRPVLVLVDDADALDDDGRTASALLAHHPSLTVVAAARGDALRQRYGHWTAAIRHSHLGLVAVGQADHDGDLLGAVLPRRAPMPARPGLWWCVSADDTSLVQVAIDVDDPDRRMRQRGAAAAQAASAAVAAIATASSERPW